MELVLALLVLSVLLIVVLLTVVSASASPPSPDVRRRIRHLERDAQKEMRRTTREFKRAFEETIAKGGPR